MPAEGTRSRTGAAAAAEDAAASVTARGRPATGRATGAPGPRDGRDDGRGDDGQHPAAAAETAARAAAAPRAEGERPPGARPDRPPPASTAPTGTPPARRHRRTTRTVSPPPGRRATTQRDDRPRREVDRQPVGVAGCAVDLHASAGPAGTTAGLPGAAERQRRCASAGPPSRPTSSDSAPAAAASTRTARRPGRGRAEVVGQDLQGEVGERPADRDRAGLARRARRCGRSAPVRWRDRPRPPRTLTA